MEDRPIVVQVSAVGTTDLGNGERVESAMATSIRTPTNSRESA